MKHVLAIRHIAFEDPGTFERMFVEWGYRIEYVDAPTGDLLDLDVLAPDVLSTRWSDRRLRGRQLSVSHRRASFDQAAP